MTWPFENDTSGIVKKSPRAVFAAARQEIFLLW